MKKFIVNPGRAWYKSFWDDKISMNAMQVGGDDADPDYIYILERDSMWLVEIPPIRKPETRPERLLSDPKNIEK